MLAHVSVLSNSSPIAGQNRKISCNFSNRFVLTGRPLQRFRGSVCAAASKRVLISSQTILSWLAFGSSGVPKRQAIRFEKLGASDLHGFTELATSAAPVTSNEKIE